MTDYVENNGVSQFNVPARTSPVIALSSSLCSFQKPWVYVDPLWLITALDCSGELFSGILDAVTNKPDQFSFWSRFMSIYANMQDSESNPRQTCWSHSVPWCCRWCTSLSRMQRREGVNTNICISCWGFRPHNSSIPLPGAWRKLKMELCKKLQVGKFINVTQH